MLIIERYSNRKQFEDLTPIFPNERIYLNSSKTMKLIDIISPIGKGQRGLIVAPPKVGKTTLLKDMAQSILCNNPNILIIILLIDERPEEVTDIKESFMDFTNRLKVLASTFDKRPQNHTRYVELTIEYAKRKVVLGKDVVILLDSITRLARAYNIVTSPSGKTLSGGMDPLALLPVKKIFGAARNTIEGGSLTIIATALIETGSKMDDMIYEEFKGTGNMELVLDRKLAEQRTFPAINIEKSSTRRDDLLLSQNEQKKAQEIRRSKKRITEILEYI